MSKKRGVPEMQRGLVDDEMQRAYMQKQAAGCAHVQAYAQRISAMRDTIAIEKASSELDDSGGTTTTSAPVYNLKLSAACRMTHAEVTAVAGKTFIHCGSGEVAQVLSRRSSSYLKLPLGASFNVITHDDALAATVLRNVLSEEDAELWSTMRQYHKTVSIGWGQGCEASDDRPNMRGPTHAHTLALHTANACGCPADKAALRCAAHLPRVRVAQADGPTNPQRVVAMMRTDTGAASQRIVKDFTVNDIQPRNGSFDNKLVVQYQNREGKVRARTRFFLL